MLRTDWEYSPEKINRHENRKKLASILLMMLSLTRSPFIAQSRGFLKAY